MPAQNCLNDCEQNWKVIKYLILSFFVENDVFDIRCHFWHFGITLAIFDIIAVTFGIGLPFDGPMTGGLTL